MTPIRPKGKRLLIKHPEAKEIKVNGIIMPGVEKRISEAIVVAVGDEIEDMNPGDVILLDKYSGQELSYADQKYVIVDLDKVLATIDQNGQSPNVCESATGGEAL